MKELIVSNKYFNVADTLECGQVFRYEKSTDGSYAICSMDKRCVLVQTENSVILRSDDVEYFKTYFDLDRDYGEVVGTLSAFPELSAAVDYGKGIRILRQNLYETVISFIISANNNITRIRSLIEKLSARYGTDMGEYYAFPTIEQLGAATVEELKAMGMGYRAQYIYDTVRTYPEIEQALIAETDAMRAHKLLCTQKGVGPKVADCITLFGMHLTRSYPVDTWIFKANKTETLSTPALVREYYLDRYGDLAGFAQQYIFHHARTAKP